MITLGNEHNNGRRAFTLIFTITSRILARSLANELSICGQTHEFIIYAMGQRARADNLAIYNRKRNKLMSVFHASDLLLTMNFFITLSK